MKAYICDTCRTVHEVKHASDSAPAGWYNVYGTRRPNTFFSATLCSPRCLAHFTRGEQSLQSVEETAPPAAPEIVNG